MEDKDSHCRLQASTEIIRIQNIYGNIEMVNGRADWALGYDTDKADTRAIFLVVEVKPYEPALVGMPKLLIYMAAVQEARQNRINKINLSHHGHIFHSSFIHVASHSLWQFHS